ncbi:unnamed protein product, partial [Thlaspi arvense]
MGSKWRKAKIALGMNLCVYFPGTEDDREDSLPPSECLSRAALLSPTSSPPTPTPSSHRLRLSRSMGRSSKRIEAKDEYNFDACLSVFAIRSMKLKIMVLPVT